MEHIAHKRRKKKFKVNLKLKTRFTNFVVHKTLSEILLFQIFFIFLPWNKVNSTI